MVNFEVTPELGRLMKRSTLDSEDIENFLYTGSIAHQDLISFYKSCKPTESLLDLIRKTKLQTQHLVFDGSSNHKEKSEDYLKWIEQLRLKAKEDEYQRLVRPKPEFETLYDIQADDDDYTPSRAHKELKSQVTTIFNVFISVFSVMYAIWYWTDSSMNIEDSYRVLLCLFFGILVLVAEVVVYLGYINKVEEAKVKERSKKEVKQVIRTIDPSEKI